MSQARHGGDESYPPNRRHPESSKKWSIETKVTVASVFLTVVVVLFGDGLFRGWLPWLEDDDAPPPASSTAAPAPSPSATSSRTASVGSTPTSGQSPSPDPAARPSVQWTGVVRLGAGVDLDKIPPTIRTSSTNADIWESSSFFVTSIKAQPQSLAPWDGSKAPTYEQCVEALSTQGTTEWGESGDEEVVADAIFCVRTSEGRVAAIKIKKEKYHNVQVTAKVWDSTDSF